MQEKLFGRLLILKRGEIKLYLDGTFFNIPSVKGLPEHIRGIHIDVVKIGNNFIRAIPRKMIETNRQSQNVKQTKKRIIVIERPRER